jgi:cation:H+ antiporter
MRNHMAMEWGRLLVGALMLYLGAEWFVAGAAALALALRVPRLIVGLTVVAYGTSAPELIVGVQAARGGHGAVALGNVLGSNLANIGLILGLTAIIRPVEVARALRSRELPVLLLSTAAILIFLRDGAIVQWEGIVLVLLAIAYTGWMILEGGRTRVPVGPGPDEAAASGSRLLRVSLKATAGLVVLLVGGSFFVDGAVAIARHSGISERIVGLTIVAVGTSLPELVTSLIAARRGHSDLAVGNVIGSNIFNAFLCLGVAALAGPIVVPMGTLVADLVALVLMTCLLAWFIRRPRVITRAEGGLALVAYAAIIVLAVLRT